jgi:hypothetical protein
MSRPYEQNSSFVEPDLVAEIPIELGKTSVVILSAPGAVGKSTVAKELAFFCKTICWDLSKVQVGSRTFVGAIYDVYEEFGHGIIKDLKDGSWLCILDALDEAQVRAGGSNFDAFLTDLTEMLKEPRSKPSMVLLARTDTATWIELFFAENGIPFAHYRIGNFSEPQAVDFIEKKLDAVRDRQKLGRVHRQQRGPFTDARKKLFNLVYKLLDVPPANAWSEPAVVSFLGYAPVLEALTDYLNHSNYQALLVELDSEADTARDPWRFLAEVVDKLLSRESTKWQTPLQSSLGSLTKETGWNAWDSLYGKYEQCRRVLEFTLKLPPGPMEAKIPLSLANEYESMMNLNIVPQHPFLDGRVFANVVFKEYLYAWGLTNGYKGLTDGLRKLMRDRSEPFLPSQLFSRFILTTEGDSLPVIEGQDLGILYDSLLTRVEDPDDMNLTILQDGEEVRLTASLDKHGQSEVECELMTAREGLQIWRRLKRADIDVSVPTELGLEGQRFLLGPGVSLSCSHLVINCDDVEIDVSEPVRLRAKSYGQASSNLRIRVWNGGPESLAVSWPNPAHPWGAYRAAETVAALDLIDDMQGDAFRKFIQMFRRQLTRRVDTVLSRRWSHEQLEMRSNLIDLALQRGVLRRDRRGKDDFFEFNIEYGSLMTLLEGTPRLTEKGLGFIVEYFGEAKANRLVRK